ncbi:MAG TPA: VWA domain-containing protein [Thermoanaerobaculia bacterium]|nr:VWA domain-containing protein [Thermoanaerobaculia bacterium]
MLTLLAAIPLAAWFFIARERTRRLRSEALVSERIRGVRFPARILRPALLVAGLGCAALALATPRLGWQLVPSLHDQGAMAITIDVSSSMAAKDLGVSRLAAAQAVAKRIVQNERGRVALVAFESLGELISPLTTDTAAVSDLIDSLTAGELSVPGSDLGAAILVALEYLRKSGGRASEIVLISDGEDQGALLDQALERASELGIAISTITAGSGEPATIPLGPRGSDLRDVSGEIVRTRADPSVMERIAEQTGGTAIANPFDGDALAALGVPRSGAELEISEGRMRRIPVERYQWPLGTALLLLLAGSFLNRGAE